MGLLGRPQKQTVRGNARCSWRQEAEVDNKPEAQSTVDVADRTQYQVDLPAGDKAKRRVQSRGAERKGVLPRTSPSKFGGWDQGASTLTREA